MKWAWLKDHRHLWKAHVAHPSLVGDLQKDLDARVEPEMGSHKNPEVREIARLGSDWDLDELEKTCFDMPGMCLQTRAIRTVDTGEGLAIDIPSQDWYDALAEVKLLKERKFASGKPYYKMHAMRHCIVLTPGQRDAMIKDMERQLEEAEVEAEADNKRFAEGIRAINERAGRTVVVSARAAKIEHAEKNKGNAN